MYIYIYIYMIMCVAAIVRNVVKKNYICKCHINSFAIPVLQTVIITVSVLLFIFGMCVISLSTALL